MFPMETLLLKSLFGCFLLKLSYGMQGLVIKSLAKVDII